LRSIPRREFIAGLGALEAVCQSNPIYVETIGGVAHRNRAGGRHQSLFRRDGEALC
jgi:hypothetical protein